MGLEVFMVRTTTCLCLRLKAENAVLSTVAIYIGLYTLTLNSSNSPSGRKNWQIANVCLADHTNSLSHEHVQLAIIINGSEVEIESNIGIGDPGCDGMKGIHTHDNTGRLHIETPSVMPALWEPFSRFGGSHSVRMRSWAIRMIPIMK